MAILWTGEWEILFCGSSSTSTGQTLRKSFQNVSIMLFRSLDVKQCLCCVWGFDAGLFVAVYF